MRDNSAQGVLRLSLCLLLIALASRPVGAQITAGSISGRLTDQSGASVPNAQVRAINNENGQIVVGRSEATGLFHIALLPVGIYTVDVSSDGFRKLVLHEIPVSSAQDTDLQNIELQLGQLSTTVEVTGAAPLVQAGQAQVSSAIQNPTIAVFPGIGENQGLDFLALQIPGVVNSRDLTISNANGVGFGVNGLRGRNNDQQIDGQNNNDNGVGGPYLPVANPDFVQEYQITTSNFGAEYGRNAGSVVNVLTKSGTNNWHGTAFSALGSSKLSTLSNTQIAFEGLTKVPTYTNQFSGGTIGGPLKKDTLFVFSGFDDRIINQTQNYSTGNLTPTPLGLGELASCFTNSVTVATLRQYGPYGIKGGNPVISGASKILDLTAPNGNPCPVEFAGVQRALPTNSHEYDVIARVDLNTATNRIYGRYIYRKATAFNGDPFGTAAAGYPANIPSFGEDIGMSWTRNISSSMVNEFRASYGRWTSEAGGNTIGNTVPPQTALPRAFTNVRMPPGFLNFGPAQTAPQGSIDNTYQAQDNWSYFYGRNLFKAGVNVTYQRSPNNFLPYVNGQYRYRNIENFALNSLQSVTVALGNPLIDFRETDTFFYFGDDIKVKPNLTLNLGLTYSYFGQPANLFHQDDVKQQTGPNPFWNPNLPLSVTTFPLIPAPKNGFAPGVGFAYSPAWGWLGAAGKTVIRGGYRLAHDPPYYNIYLNIATSAPQALLQTLTGKVALAAPLPPNPFGPAVRAALAPILTLGVFDPRAFNQTTIPANFRSDRVQSWSFGLQRELSPNAVIESRYVGNQGSDLFQGVNGNPDVSVVQRFPSVIPPGISPCPAAAAVVLPAIGRANCALGVVKQRNNGAVSNYGGWQTEFRATNLASQLTLRTSYTWSKTMDNASEVYNTFAAGGTTSFAQDPFNTGAAEYALSGLDVPQRWTLSFVEQIPVHRDQKGLVGKLLGGWAVSGSYIIASGQPYTPTQVALNNMVSDSGFVSAFDFGIENLRPFLSNPNAQASNVGMYAADACADFSVGCNLAASSLISLNAIKANGSASSVAPAAVRFIVNGPQANTLYGTPYGNVGRNTLRDYHTNIANFSLFKNTNLTERFLLQWRMDMVNVFNHPNFYSVDPFVDDAGLATEATGFALPTLFSGANPLNLSIGQRNIFFGLKLIF